MQITLDIPDHLLPPQQDKVTLAQQLKLHTALMLFQTGKLSRGAACELAGIDIYAFLSACKQYKVETISAGADEIEDEVSRFKQLHAL